MSRKVNKSMVDQQLLNAIVTLESEWKYIQSILENSIEPGENILYKQDLAEAKYLYLLREARHRKISAVRFPQYSLWTGSVSVFPFICNKKGHETGVMTVEFYSSYYHYGRINCIIITCWCSC